MQLPEPHAEPTPRWVRVRVDGTVVADSRRAWLLSWYGPGRLPTYFFPDEDVVDGAAGIRLGDEAPFPELAGMWTFPWDDDRVTWFEEATPVFVHARDPNKRVDVVPSERHVRIELDGELLAESRRPSALFENPLPPRWYLPPEDVRMDLLEPTDTRTRCPYKGEASYFAALGRADLAWTYPDPIPECPGVKDLICFFQEQVDLVIDGERLARPVTPWS